MVSPISAFTSPPARVAARRRSFGQPDDAMASRTLMFAVAAGLTIAALGFGLALVGGVNAGDDPATTTTVQVGPPGR